MKHNLTMIAETPEPGVFVTVIKDGDEVIDTVKATTFLELLSVHTVQGTANRFSLSMD